MILTRPEEITEMRHGYPQYDLMSFHSKTASLRTINKFVQKIKSKDTKTIICRITSKITGQAIVNMKNELTT